MADPLLERTCRLIAAFGHVEWGAMDREMQEELLESVADTSEWLDLMAFVDGVTEYRARPESEHVRVLGQALSRAGLGFQDRAWNSLEALARLVEAGPRCDCPHCGPRIAIDEDGCCVSCGADALMITDG